MLNPIHLRTLIAVVELGSFADAARTLGYTGSAVSQQIAALERSVRLPLFERSAQSVRPTSVGLMFAARARESLSSLQLLREDLAAIADGTVGRLRIGSFPTASQRLLPIALAGLQREHPRIEVLLDEGEPADSVRLLLAGELDMALVYHYDLAPGAWPTGFRRRPLFTEALVLLLPEWHVLADRSSVHLQALSQERWIATKEGTAGAKSLVRLCAQHGFEPRVAVRTNDYDVVRGFVGAGLGVALIPALSHRPFEGVRGIGLEGTSASRHGAALHRPTEYNPTIGVALNKLLAAVTQVARETDGVHAARSPAIPGRAGRPGPARPRRD